MPAHTSLAHSPVPLVGHIGQGLEEAREALVVGSHVDSLGGAGGGRDEALAVGVLLVEPGKRQVVATPQVREDVVLQHCKQRKACRNLVSKRFERHEQLISHNPT